MHNHYIINETIEFHPATSTLKDIHNPDRVVTLNSPAGRCLLLLINKLGLVVTQNEFMDIVWKQSGMLVTSNAYYQNISVLRKGLKRIGLGGDIIVTLPRIGLTLASGTRIRKLTIETAVDVSHYNVQSINVPELAHEALESHTSAMLPNDLTEVALSNSPSLRHRLAGSRCTNDRIVAHYLLVFMIIAACIFLLFLNMSKTKPIFFSNYVPVVTVKKCEILLPSMMTENADKANAIRYGERFTQDCQKHPSWIYVTTISNLPRASVIRCNKPYGESTSCISAYFIE